jgi:hypothetical protein
VPLRVRWDWWRDAGARPMIVDLKTTTDASPGAFRRSIASLRYHLQDAWYTTAARIIHGLDADPPFVFVAQEKDPPYLVGIYQLDDEDRAVGRALMRQAVATFARCLATDEWPGYPAQVLTLPRWAQQTQETQ